MTARADAIVTGFVQSPVLLERSLAPLRELKQAQVLRDIHYVTWDTPEIDAHVAPLAKMPDIHLVRVPQPSIEGCAEQRGLIYQIRNLDNALALIAEEDTVVLKLRPDFVACADFLRDKIITFGDWSAVPAENTALGIAMPKPVLRDKIWIPWADSNQPFFYEDGAFMGRKRDLRKLVTEVSPHDLGVLSDPDCGWYAHVVRYARIFLPQYPLFARYLRDYRFFVNDLEYRLKQLTRTLQDGFFWHMLIAHAWILHTQFHVDIGEQGDINFYPNNANRNVDWSRPETLRVAPPYDHVSAWRAGTRPTAAMPSVQRSYGRLMDDAWQTALFTRTRPDLPRETLIGLIENVAQCGDGRLNEIEAEFYQKLALFYREGWLRRQPVSAA